MVNDSSRKALVIGKFPGLKGIVLSELRLVAESTIKRWLMGATGTCSIRATGDLSCEGACWDRKVKRTAGRARQF